MTLLDQLATRPSLNLFPTENRLSPRALAALASDAVNRYPTSEGDDYFYGDVMGLRAVYTVCEDLARQYFGARHALVPFLSGLHTMHSVLTALCAPGDHLLIMDPGCGGHFATAPICAGYGFDHGFLPFDRASCRIDTAALADLATRRPLDLIYLDLSTAVRMPDVRALRAAAPGVRICLDASHLLGLLPAAPQTLVLDGVLDTISGSTHKTFPGPQKGLLVTDDDAVAERVGARAAVTVSSGHSASTAALAITLEELLPDRVAYAEQVIHNARRLAVHLVERGFDVPGAAFGHTETHQIWVQPPPDAPPKGWGKRLAACGIRSTTVSLPSSGRSGLRLGVQELTRMGMRDDAMAEVAGILVAALVEEDAPDDVAARVARLVGDHGQVRWADGAHVPGAVR